MMLAYKHWRSQSGGRGGEGPSPSEWEKNIKASLVNLTINNMRYKNDKKYQICDMVPDSFFQAQNAPKSVLARTPLGELRRSPRPLVGWGGDMNRISPIPLLIPLPTWRSNSVPRFSGPLNTKSGYSQSMTAASSVLSVIYKIRSAIGLPCI